MSQFSLNVLKFEDVRAKIIEVLKENSEYTGIFDFEGSNIAMMVDTMAYVTMLMSYQLSNVTNNMYLDTTSLRKNAVSIAKTMGYRPKRVVSAKMTGTIEYYDADKTFTENDQIVIPTQTQFIAENGFVFINTSPIILTVSSEDSSLLVANVELVEGTSKTFTYLGTGLPFQSFIIPSKVVEENNFNLYVKNNIDNVSTLWNEVKQSFNLLDKNSYFLEEDNENEGYLKVIFGDGLISNYPSNSQVVIVNYIESNADAANYVSMLSFDQSFVVGNFVGFDATKFNALADTLTKSYGGAPYQTLDEIKEAAPKSFAAAGRAVTQNDYKNLLSENSYILKSNVIGGDTLFKGDSTKLGNIYLTAVPIYVDITDLLNSDSIYLSSAQEIDLLSDFNRYRILSTSLHFMKPSYIYVEANPVIEVENDIKTVEEQRLISDVTSTLQNYVNTNYNEFNQTVRASKLNSSIGNFAGVVSSEINFEYHFILTKNTFENVSSENNFILLPVKIESRDSQGNITGITNFVKTNAEQKVLLGIAESELLPYEERTIYGQISNPTVDRFIYNEDIVLGGQIESCDLYIKGDNLFFKFYRFEADYNSNLLSGQKTFTVDNTVKTLEVTPVVSGDIPDQFDNYSIKLSGGADFATIKRTDSRNNGYQGLAYAESDVTENVHGNFYEVIQNFSVTGADKNFTSVLEGEYIIYNADLSGGLWIKTNNLGNISAADDSGLFKTIQNNIMYQIAPSADGNFGGKTESVSGGDTIIFNINSISNPTYKWEKVENKYIDYDMIVGLDASIDLPLEAVDYELKCVSNTIGTTDFGGRTVSGLSDGDIIYFNPAQPLDTNKWTFLINSSQISAMPASATVDAAPVTGGSLEGFIYDQFNPNAVQIGTLLRVINIGSFGTSVDKVNWNGTPQAYHNDLLVYIGKDANDNPKWNIYQPSYPSVFNVDSTNPNTLPVNINYGDAFTVAVSGDFNGQMTETFDVGDMIVYVGDSTWVKHEVEPTLLYANVASGLPAEASIGDFCYVTEDGSFGDSYIISPAGDTFVQGDYIIFNGTNWTKMREYTIEYLDMNNEVNGRAYLNELGFNSVFYYKYNTEDNNYEIYFNDIFHGSKIGTFKYNTFSESLLSIYEVGKLTLFPQITGMYDLTNDTDLSNISVLFGNEDINLIRFLPKNKLDSNGNVTSDPMTDFDTFFNNFVNFKINTAVTIK